MWAFCVGGVLSAPELQEGFGESVPAGIENRAAAGIGDILGIIYVMTKVEIMTKERQTAYLAFGSRPHKSCFIAMSDRQRGRNSRVCRLHRRWRAFGRDKQGNGHDRNLHESAGVPVHYDTDTFNLAGFRNGKRGFVQTVTALI